MKSKLKNKLFILVFILSIGIFSTSQVIAATPSQSLTYEGQIFDNGVAPTGTISATFTFYDALTGGSVSGTQISKSLSVQSGNFSATFSLSEIAGVDLNQQLYLEVTLNGTTLSPRSTILPTLSSLKSFGAFSYTTAPAVGPTGSLYYNTSTLQLFVSNGTVWTTIGSTSPWSTGSSTSTSFMGSVGIGTTTPASPLTVVGTSTLMGAFTFVGGTVTIMANGSTISKGQTGSLFLGLSAGNGVTNNAYESNFIGTEAGSGATSGFNSNFFGQLAGKSATSAFRSNFSGFEAGNNATYANNSNFSGYQAGKGATSAYASNFFGQLAGLSASDARYSNFFGYYAGNGATSAYASNFIGSSAGYFATSANSSNFIGSSAGYTATNASYSNFIGSSAGSNATNANASTFIGAGAGYFATNASISIFIGNDAGSSATNATRSIFFGNNSGYGASAASYSNFMGPYAGNYATNASYSNFFGSDAGNSATNASYSNFFGETAGQGATNSTYSNFIGISAGSNAQNAANSIFIGRNSGISDNVNNTSGSKSSILIGNYTKTGGFSNSISIGQGTQNSAVDQLNIGRVLYASGISSSTSPSAVPIDDGRIGIGTSTPTAQLTTTDTVRFSALTGAGANLIVDSLGNVTVSSDERLKDIQGEFLTGLDKIKGLTPINYKWKPETGYDTTNTYSGFSAQNVQANIPEAVSTDSRGFLTLADRPILAALVNAVKELAKKIEGFAKLIESDKVKTNELCIGSTCVTENELKQILLERAINSNSSTVIEPPVVVEPVAEPVVEAPQQPAVEVVT